MKKKFVKIICTAGILTASAFTMVQGATVQALPYRQAQVNKNPDSTNWCWVCAAQCILSQVTDDVPTQTSLFLERAKNERALRDINAANGMGSTEDLKQCLVNYANFHSNLGPVVRRSFMSEGLFAPGVFAFPDTLNELRAILNTHGAVAVVQRHHWTVLTRIYVDNGIERVEYMSNNNRGILRDDADNYFDHLGNGFEYAYIDMDTLNLHGQRIASTNAAIARLTAANQLDVRNAAGNTIHTIRAGVDYEIYSSAQVNGNTRYYLDHEQTFYVEDPSIQLPQTQTNPPAPATTTGATTSTAGNASQPSTTTPSAKNSQPQLTVPTVTSTSPLPALLTPLTTTPSTQPSQNNNSGGCFSYLFSRLCSCFKSN